MKVGPRGTAAEGFLDRAKYLRDESGERKYTDQMIEDLKILSRVIPVQSTLIVFWCTYAQMSSVIFSQGTVMNLTLEGTSFVVPVALLNIFNSAAILILVPIFDRLVYPGLIKLNINFSPLRRIGVGLILASSAMLYSGGLEIWRKQLYAQGKVVEQTLGGKDILAVDLSVFWQAPAFILIGCGEVLASITGLQFAYDEAPPTMRSMVQATNLLSTGLGSFLGLLLLAVINAISTKSPWIADDMNTGHLDLYFLTLCALGILNFFYFLFVSNSYVYRKRPQ